MSNPTVTLVGAVVTEPELRFTPSGAALCGFTVVTKDRRKVGETWEDKDPTFLRVTAWRRVAENVAESALAKGQEVVVVGRLHQRDYDDRDGNRRTSYEVNADAVAVSLAWNSVTVVRPERKAAGEAPPDPWTTGQQQQQAFDDTPPF